MAPVPLLTLSVILLGAALSPSHALDAPHQYDYIVIGAGPAGLQMGYFLKSAARDYIILERANISGMFIIHTKTTAYWYLYRGHGGAVVVHLPPTSEVGGSNPRPHVGKFLVAY